MTTLAEAALAYAARGWPVFPLKPRDKTPATAKGFKDATTEPGQVKRWWKAMPQANIGIATGMVSSLLVLDVDKGGAETLRQLERQHGELPETPQVLTGGGGCHHYFHLNGHSQMGNSQGLLGPGIDTRATGGYVAAPPSVHPSGKLYQWEVVHDVADVPLAEPPPWLVELLTRSKGGNGPPPPVPEIIREGQRHATMVSLAGTLRNRGLTGPEILTALQGVNARCEPPVELEELQRIASDIGKRPPARPVKGHPSLPPDTAEAGRRPDETPKAGWVPGTSGLEIKADVGGYSLRWPQEKVLLKARHVKATRDETSVELSIHAIDDNGVERSLYAPTKLNLLAGQTRDRWAKTLCESLPLGVTRWRAIWEESCLALIDAIRRGEPVKELWSNEQVTAPGWFLWPFMPYQQPTAIFADGDSGKSLVALPMAFVACYPWLQNPWGWRPDMYPDGCQALLLDWEGAEHEMRWRWAALHRGLNTESAERLFYRHCSMPLADDLEAIQKNILWAGAKLIIIDSLSMAAGTDDLNSSKSAGPFYAALRQLRDSDNEPLTVLIIAHNSKARQPEGRTIIGHQTFTTQARATWELRCAERTDKSRLDICMWHRKHNFSPQYDPMSYRIQFRADSWSMVQTDPDDMFGEDLPLRERITQLLQRWGEPMKAGAIAEELGATENAVRSQLTRGHALFERTGGGLWRPRAISTPEAFR